MPDAYGGAGSLGQTLPEPTAPTPKTDFQIFSPDFQFIDGQGWQVTSGGYGLLADLNSLSFDWYRDASSTSLAHLTPSFRLILWDPDAGEQGTSYYAIWEGVYNGYPAAGPGAPTNTWVHSEMDAGKFWRVPQYVDGTFAGIGSCNVANCFRYIPLSDWNYGPNTVVIGLEVGLGSGWATYHSFVDHITLGIGANLTTWDFEPSVGPPTSKDECKNGGWQSFDAPSPFANQGQCMQYVNTGK